MSHASTSTGRQIQDDMLTDVSFQELVALREEASALRTARLDTSFSDSLQALKQDLETAAESNFGSFEEIKILRVSFESVPVYLSLWMCVSSRALFW